MAYRLLENGARRQLEAGTGRLLESYPWPPLYLPWGITAVLLATGNTDPFGIDPEQTKLIAGGDTDPFGIDPEQTQPLRGSVI